MTNQQEEAELRSLLHGDIQSDLGFADIREWGAEQPIVAGWIGAIYCSMSQNNWQNARYSSTGHLF